MKTTRTKNLPPFYTHAIGSLPRPKFVLSLLEKKDSLEPERFRKVMDEMVVFAIRLQEEAGLDVVSDGEWRRIHYIDEFLKRIGNFKAVRKFRHQGEIKFSHVVVEKIKTPEPVFTQDAQLLTSHIDRKTKFALPSPFLIATRYWHEDYSRDAYATKEHFMDSLADVIGVEAQNLVDTGIDIVQIDDPALTYFCDPRLISGQHIHDERLRRKWDSENELPRAIAALNKVTELVRAEVHLHCCHSVYKRKSDVIGNYKPLLPHLHAAKIDQVNLEFAYTQTGETDDLLLLPDHLSVGMGVIDVRKEKVTHLDEILEKVSADVKAVGFRRIALNPDCGFVPDAFEPPTIDEAFDKLKQLVCAAHMVREKYSM
jgi:5-methyltetrahydropteroyltriglutamate--homocysteine methyltransferase